jgi:hypothetical protein
MTDIRDRKVSMQGLFEMDTADVSPNYFEGQILYGEWEWANITATRQNPVVRDVIPRMGLQLAVASAQDSLKQTHNNPIPVCDRWWTEYNEKDGPFSWTGTERGEPEVSTTYIRKNEVGGVFRHTHPIAACVATVLILNSLLGRPPPFPSDDSHLVELFLRLFAHLCYYHLARSK